MSTLAPRSVMSTLAPNVRVAPREDAPPSDPLDFFRGLALAIPISLLMWAGIIRGGQWLLASVIGP